jgi:anti-sigma B factor antagonist
VDQTTDSLFVVERERLEPGRCAIVVRGAIDLFAAPELKRRLLEAVGAGTREVVLDLRGASFVDSTGLGALLATRKRLAARDGRLIIVLNQPRVDRVFEITGLDTIFELAATREAALEVLDGSAAASGAGAAHGTARRG